MQVEKTLAGANMVLTGVDTKYNENRRGLNIYTLSQLLGVTGRTKGGEYITGTYEQSLYYLSIDERIAISRLCSPVAGIIASRMNRIGGMKWDIVSSRSEEDKIYEKLRTYKQIYDEYKTATELKYAIVRAQLYNNIRRELTDVLPDLSNFDRSLLRWKRFNQTVKLDFAEQIKEWVYQPNINDNFTTLTKKIVHDLMVHGCVAIYKEICEGRVENVYVLPGGTVVPLKNKFVSGADGYVQIAMGAEPQIMFSDELAYANYIPNTARAWGNIPLESLVNKIAESMLFDKLMAEQADGTIMPNKMVVVGENNPFGVLSEQYDMPLDVEEQRRVETKLNQPKKGGVITFSGNTATVVDLTRENTMAVQMQRQKDIREEVGLVFNASNLEMNLTGSSNTSGRETSESQQEVSEGRGIIPICQIIEEIYNRGILMQRFGPGWRFEFETSRNELAEIQLLQAKVQTGLYSINELRVDELGIDPLEGDEYNKPLGQQPQQQEQQGMQI